MSASAHALGICGAVAPLTTAVLNSVDAHHTSSASGSNSGKARPGGLVATALVGLVLAAQGEWLIFAFHAATLVGAALCIAASLSAIVLIDAACLSGTPRRKHVSPDLSRPA